MNLPCLQAPILRKSLFLLVCQIPSCLYNFLFIFLFLSFDNISTTHLHGEYLLGHRQRWQFCGTI